MISVPGSLLEFVDLSAKVLEQKNISDSRLNAELLLCDVLKCSRIDLYLNFDKPLTKDEISLFKSILRRRMNHEPLQYILGKTSFYGLDFKVNNNVLIPRQETELLVERVINDVKTRSLKEVTVFEIGTGSGCIAIALAKILDRENINVKIISTDVSEAAIEVARENSVLNGIGSEKIKFIAKDFFEIDKLSRDFNYIVSNPPYISYDEFNKLDKEVKDFEPKIALTDNEKGLKFFEHILMIASAGDFTGKVYCEIGYGQKEDIEKILLRYDYLNYYFHKDYNGIFRILEVCK